MIKSNSTIFFFFKEPTHKDLSIIRFHEVLPYLSHLLYLHLFSSVFSYFCQQFQSILNNFRLRSVGIICDTLNKYFDERTLKFVKGIDSIVAYIEQYFDMHPSFILGINLLEAIFLELIINLTFFDTVEDMRQLYQSKFTFSSYSVSIDHIKAKRF